jgi:hypothetical protein
MGTRTRQGRLAVAAGMVLALAIPLLAPAESAVAAQSLSVNLASTTGAATGVGEGFLYGVSQDGTQPADQFLLPLGITAQRGGGHASRGWIGDGYQYGSGTQADVNSAIAQARRVTQAPSHAQYQVILSDVYGADGGQPSSTTYPCDNGNCSNWVSFIDSAVGALQASGLKFAYDIWNEPDISLFWTRGVDSTQYFQMWDTAAREIRRIAPGALIVGPSAAFTPQQNPSEWQTWLAHVKAAGTLPDEISNHDEGDGDDPVTVAQAIDSDLAANGIPRIPLSANEFQPQNQQAAGQSAWYLARFAQSGYTNAMRGNWNCCLTPNLTGIIVPNGSGGGSYTGNWWAFRAYADLTGSLVSTSGEVGTTAISAAEDSSRRRAVAIVGDENGYTGAASVTFNGLSSVPWLANNSSIGVTVYRIPDQSPLNSPQVVFNQVMSTSGGSVTVPLTFQSSHDAFAIYVTPGFAPGFTSTLVNQGSGLCMDEFDWTTAALAQFDQWTCNGGTNQQFSFVPTSAGSSTYFIHPMTPDYCLDVAGASTASGAAIAQYPCNYNSNEQFTLHAVGSNVYQVVVQNSGLCIVPSGDSTANGTSLVQTSCTTAGARTWKIQVG